MRLIVPLVTVLVSLILLASAAAGRDIFVDNAAGDDRFSGELPTTQTHGLGPLRTINRATMIAQQGDRIVLANTGRPYREGVSLVGHRHSGFAADWFQIVGHGATLDGSAPVPADAWEHYQGPVFRFEPAHVAYQQLFLAGRPLVPVVSDPAATRPAKLKPLEWTLHRAYVYFCVERTKLPQDYAISFASLQTGITLLHVERVEIRDLVIQGFQLDGINAFNSARDVALIGVTSRGNGRAGVTVDGACRVRLENCLIGDNNFAQILTFPWSETYLHATEIVANTAPAWVDQGGKVFKDEMRSGK